MQIETEQQFNERMQPLADKFVEDKTITRRSFLCIGLGGLIGLVPGVKVGNTLHNLVSDGMAKEGITMPPETKTVMTVSGGAFGSSVGAAIGAAVSKPWEYFIRERNKMILEAYADKNKDRELTNKLIEAGFLEQ